jgi:hypothetical protein
MSVIIRTKEVHYRDRMAKSPLSKALAETVTKRSVLADGSLCFRTSKFTQVMTRLAPGRMLVTGIGYNDGRCAPLITEEMSRAMPRRAS